MSFSEEDRARRLAAKKNNERVKLAAGALNALGIAVAGAAVILPAINEQGFLLTIWPWILLLSALGRHMAAQTLLSPLRSED